MSAYSPTPEICLDVDLLIAEVHKRPVLWNRLSVDYNSKVQRGLLWEEVHGALFYDWNDLGATEKRIRREEVKKKWRNLRDSYSKELTIQWKAKKGKIKRKKPYCHFQALSFLRQQISKVKPDIASSSSSSEDEKPSQLPINEGSSKKLKIELDVPHFLNEVKKRPVLWNRHTYTEVNNDKVFRLNNWMEVCKAVFKNWDELNLSEQSLRCEEVKKKWRNYRDAYGRELAARKREAQGIKRSKRNQHPYKYHEELTFLEGQFNKWPDFDPSFQQQEPEDISNNSNFSIESDNEADNTEELVELPVEIAEHKGYDEDVSFTEMLVPLLKKLNDDQKHYAQVEILNVLNKARRFDPLSIIGHNRNTIIVKSENDSQFHFSHVE